MEVVECLNRARRVAGSRLNGGTALCYRARHFIPCLVLAQLSDKNIDWGVKHQHWDLLTSVVYWKPLYGSYNEQ